MNSAPTKRLRIGAVSYLNTKPLVFGLDKFASQFELVFDLPSRLADGLSSGRFDIALIPSIEFFQDRSYKIVSNACIACRGPVWSVKVLSRVPMAKIRTLALDEGSRTSVALVKILLKERYGVEPETCSLPIGAATTSAVTDAVLLIGDRAMHVRTDEFCEVWDLGEEWCRWADLPFVFAMWVARSGVATHEIASLLESARDLGVENVREIADREAHGAGLTTEQCLGYLRDNLHFALGPREQRGLKLFQNYATQFGLADRQLPIEPILPSTLAKTPNANQTS